MNPWPYPRWIAHRGAGKLAPENTLAAFRLGASLGYRAFECDLKLSADGVAFLLHDATLERTTTGQGLAGEQLWSDLSRLDAGSWHGPTYAGEPIASLDAVARFVLGNGYHLNLELKPTPGTDHATGVAVGLACLRLWPAGAVPPLFSSFQPEALQGALASAPAIPRALLLDELSASCFDTARGLGCVAMVLNQRLASHALIAQIHAAGMRALVFTVNDEPTAQRLQADGIDGLITDAVDRFTPMPG